MNTSDQDTRHEQQEVNPYQSPLAPCDKVPVPSETNPELAEFQKQRNELAWGWISVGISGLVLGALSYDGALFGNFVVTVMMLSALFVFGTGFIICGFGSLRRVHPWLKRGILLTSLGFVFLLAMSIYRVMQVRGIDIPTFLFMQLCLLPAWGLYQAYRVLRWSREFDQIV